MASSKISKEIKVQTMTLNERQTLWNGAIRFDGKAGKKYVVVAGSLTDDDSVEYIPIGTGWSSTYETNIIWLMNAATSNILSSQKNISGTLYLFEV